MIFWHKLVWAIRNFLFKAGSPLSFSHLRRFLLALRTLFLVRDLLLLVHDLLLLVHVDVDRLIHWWINLRGNLHLAVAFTAVGCLSPILDRCYCWQKFQVGPIKKKIFQSYIQNCSQSYIQNCFQSYIQNCFNLRKINLQELADGRILQHLSAVDLTSLHRFRQVRQEVGESFQNFEPCPAFRRRALNFSDSVVSHQLFDFVQRRRQLRFTCQKFENLPWLVNLKRNFQLEERKSFKFVVYTKLRTSSCNFSSSVEKYATAVRYATHPL